MYISIYRYKDIKALKYNAYINKNLKIEFASQNFGFLGFTHRQIAGFSRRRRNSFLFQRVT